MNSLLRRTALAVGILAALAACSDSEVIRDPSASSAAPAAPAPGGVHVGMPLDSVYAAVGKGPFTGTSPDDTIRVMHGHRARMMVTGNHLLRILFLRSGSGTLDGPIERSKDTPIVIEGQKVVANGWSEFDRLAKDLSLPALETKP